MPKSKTSEAATLDIGHMFSDRQENYKVTLEKKIIKTLLQTLVPSSEKSIKHVTNFRSRRGENSSAAVRRFLSQPDVANGSDICNSSIECT